MTYRRKAEIRRARRAGIVFVGFIVAVTAITVTAVFGTSEPAYACLLGIPGW